MARTKYKKRIVNGKEYYYYRVRHPNLKTYKDVYALTPKELDYKIKELLEELDHNIDNKELFGPFFCNWLFEVNCINKKPSTRERYEGIYRNYIKDSPLVTMKIKDLKALDIQSYYNKLFRDGKSVSSIRFIHKLIAPFIRYAYNNNMIIKDFSKALVLPQENETAKLNKESDVKSLSLEEQRRFINAIKGHELESLFLTALNSGLRQGELFALTWSDIDFENAIITVNKTAKFISAVSENGREKSKIVIQTPKTKRSIRKVPIPKYLVRQLTQHKLSQTESKNKLGSNYQNHNLVFCTEFGTYLDSSNVLKRLRKILKDNNLPEIKFHDLRHTYATRLFELGENPKTVQELLGHSNIGITLNTYTHVLDSLKEKAISKLNELYDEE